MKTFTNLINQYKEEIANDTDRIKQITSGDIESNGYG